MADIDFNQVKVRTEEICEGCSSEILIQTKQNNGKQNLLLLTGYLYPVVHKQIKKIIIIIFF